MSEAEWYDAGYDWTDKRGGRWRATFHYEVVTGRLRLVGFDLRATQDDPAEVMRHVIQAFPLAAGGEATRLDVTERPEYLERHPRWAPPPEWQKPRPLPKKRELSFPSHKPLEWFTAEWHTMREWLRANADIFDLPKP